MGKLIRLELFNFKSYKGHHTLLFGDSYFTSIIGPNGSGKSNSMDAISFVLGIKSSHLRSAHLKDLVYRGRVLKTSKINDDGSVDPSEHANDGGDGEEKASRGDPKTAWVMAVYEDDAGDEQRWKRSITNQGASEYRINDRIVTAQQYNEALEAENILMKARNFLVFQGDVEAIASQSPQDLTRLVEQISGSLDYKAEYEKLQSLAEQAVENQNFQLHRRRGINSEIKQYREQKKEADNFQKKMEERDAAIVTQTMWKLYHSQKAIDESKAAIQNHQEDLKDMKRDIETFEKRLEAARKEQSTTLRQVSQIEREIKNKERSIEDKENSIIPLDEKINETTRRKEQLNSQIERITRERDEQVSVIEKVNKDIESVDKAEKVFEKDIKEQMKQQGREISDSDRKEYNSLHAQVMAEASSNQAELEHLERSRKADEVTVNNLRGKVESVSAAIEKSEAELSTINERKETAQSVASELSSSIASKKKEFNRLQSERVEANQKRTELEEKLEDVARKLREADDGRRQNDKETRIKEMKKYEEAVLVALGRNFDSVVVDTEKVGSDCIAYLREQRFPTMSFIPLDNIKVPTVNTVIKSFSGARLTIDTINFDSSVERAIAYACGNSVVCDSLDVAKHICYDKKTPVEAVTLDGFVIHESGTMTGGRGPENKNGKRRFEEADVQNLQRIANKLTEDIDRLPRADRRGAVEEGLQTELSGLERRLVIVKDELVALNKNYASKKRELDSQKKELKELRPKYDKSASALEKLVKNVQKHKDAIARVEDAVFAGFCSRLGYSDIRAYEASQGEFEQEVSEKRSQYSVQKQRLESRLNWEMTRHKETEARIKKVQNLIRSLSRDIKSFAQQKTEIEEELNQVQAELEALRETLEEYKEELTERAQRVTEAKAELQRRSKGIDSRLREITQLESEVQKSNSAKLGLLRRCRLEQIQIPLLNGNLDNLPVEDDMLRPDVDAMDVDGEDDDEAMMDFTPDDHGIEIDYSGLDDELKESNGNEVEETLSEKIMALGIELEKLNPNMRAMERLEGVETRLRQTDQEYEDSKKAAFDAKESFREIKEKRYELFSKAFSHIQEQITHVYRDLTRSEAYPLGGQAYLDIEEDTDMPYLSGIKYHAMPPLKRFRDMEHLSGGEKTMAALALLFAIHSYQPSPFFVLDEVDAALDNANVDKIKKYIREHAGPGMQFVVISLKAGLFQDSESLVGVYRDQEVNSSRTLTLDLRKYA
ncbi:structural maintenance of chromosome 1 [Geosmithia morbida]|uniref:Structural maintenance of chromosomes protein n=1 Tax=Geosmithia morbida TaxID=1094350 RepID=A0A9P4YRH8_9HYPO|nr:structural maintenance of chromosome 1 [Geosmithia morbida]KAF4121778.1 structural maintenance of chromosome 1 [Geosmithia morbida]